MSASIAHEVNQPLAAIVANSHACQQWLSAEPPNLQRAQVTIARVIRDAKSAGDTVGGMRALFKRGALIKIPLNLNEVISEVRQLMHDEANARAISLQADLEINLPAISADRLQMQQVLVNLIRNGIDATETTNETRKLISIRSQLDGLRMVLVEIQDQGGGIEDPERIFEPFFTTKKTGMGMGLAICRSIVEAHAGRLWATRNDHGGTTFSFTLPTQADNAA
jgi:signal transduction histidine kinase